MKTPPALVIPLLFLTSLLYGDELPNDLKALNDRRSLKIEQINEVYKTELIKLREKYTKAADLKSANLVQSVIDKCSEPLVSDEAPPTDSTKTKLQDSKKETSVDQIIGKWRWHNSEIKYFLADGTIIGDGVPGKWKCVSNATPPKYELNWGDRFLETVNIVRGGKEIKGKSKEGAGVSAYRVTEEQKNQ